MKKNTIFKCCASLALGLALSSNLCASYTIETIAGTAGTAGFSGDGGPATAAKISNPAGICVDSAENILFADLNNARIRKITASNGYISTIAGDGTASFSGDESAATSAQIHDPFGVCFDGSGNILFADRGNNRIRMVSNVTGTVYGISCTAGDIYTIAGTGAVGHSGDGGLATAALLKNPYGICVDNSGNIYFTDTSNNSIRTVNATSGIISTIAGTATAGYSGDGGPATAALLKNPYGICVDSSGNIYFADRSNNRIRMVNATSGIISTIAGTGIAGYSGDGGPATAALLKNPGGICVDNSGNIYFTDTSNNSIRMVNATSGIISTIAGTGTAGYSGDGGPATAALLKNPKTVCINSSGDLYFTDSDNSVIRKLSTPPTSLNIEVDSGSATVSAPLTATIVHKIGNGTATLSGDNSGVSTLQIDAGLVQVSATKHMGNAITFAGGNMEVTSGTIAVPTAAMNAPGTITTDAGAAVSSVAAPSSTSLLTFAGAGVVTAGDMHTSLTPISIPGIMHVGAIGSKLTAGVITVPSNGLLEIMAATAASVPGITEVQSGGILQVAANVAVPTNGSSNGDIFNNGSTGGSLKFDTGAILKLGASSSWARNITVGTAL